MTIARTISKRIPFDHGAESQQLFSRVSFVAVPGYRAFLFGGKAGKSFRMSAHFSFSGIKSTSEMLHVSWFEDPLLQTLMPSEKRQRPCGFYSMNRIDSNSSDHQPVYIVKEFPRFFSLFPGTDECSTNGCSLIPIKHKRKSLSWKEASDLCHSMGTTLPSVLDKFVLLNVLEVTCSQCTPFTEAVFVGLSFYNMVSSFLKRENNHPISANKQQNVSVV